MLNARPIERPETLKELAYREIKAQLTGGRLSADTVYSANGFAEILKVSRTPVREALLQLAAEGYLEFIEGRGFRLRRFSAKEVRDFFEVRRLIEIHVAERLAGALAAADLRGVEASFKRMERLARDRDAFLEADREFHLGLIERLDNPFLESIAAHIRDRMSAFAVRALSHEGRTAEVLREHREILEAFRAGSRERVVAAVRDHLLKTERYVLEAGTGSGEDGRAASPGSGHGQA